MSEGKTVYETEEGEGKVERKEILPDKTRFNDEMAALMSK